MASDEVDLEFKPERHNVLLQRYHGKQVAVNTSIAEWQPLPTTASGWELHFDLDGHACFTNDHVEEEVWAMDLFEFPVMVDPSQDNKLCIVRSGQQVWLCDYITEKVPEQTLQVSGPHGLAWGLTISGMRTPMHGAYLWWHALRLHSALQLKSQKEPGRWASHGWHRWAKFLQEEMGLPRMHVLNTCTNLEDISLVGPYSAEEVAGMDRRSLSTHALLALLARWCWAPQVRGGMTIDSDVNAAHAFLQSLLSQDVDHIGNFTWTLCIDIQAAWDPPALPNGNQPLDIKIVSGQLQLQEFSNKNAQCVMAVVQALTAAGAWGEEGQVLVIDVVRVLSSLTAKGSASTQWFLKQLMWALGSVVDQCFYDIVAIQSDPKLADTTRRKQKRDMFRYLVACREVMKNPAVLHLAVDGISLGKKPCLCGLMALPSNDAMILPPQVL